jgi:hypothetical protein
VKDFTPFPARFLAEPYQAVCAILEAGIGRFLGLAKRFISATIMLLLLVTINGCSEMVCQYTSGKYLGKTDDGQRVYAVDDTTQFLCTRTWDGSPGPDLYAITPEDVFTNSVASGVYIKGHYINSVETANLFLSLFNSPGEIYEYNPADAKRVPIYVCYGGLPIATVCPGEISIVDDLWIYTSQKEISRYFNIHSAGKDYAKINGTVFSDEKIVQILKTYIA